MEKSKSLRSSLLLLLTAIIWGLAFVAQSKGMEFVGPLTFSFSRCVIGAVFLYILIKLFPKVFKRQEEYSKSSTIIGGVICGVILAFAMGTQQIGIASTTVGKAGFITALYIVIVPIINMFFGYKTDTKIWICVLFALVGFYLMSIHGGFSIGYGDLMVLISAIIYSIHIIVITRYSPKSDGVVMSMIQFAVAGVLFFIAMVLFEDFRFKNVLSAALPILYAGILSTGIGYTLQIVAMKDIDPTIGSMILSLESVFALIGGIIILGETMTTRESIGAALVFIASFVAQLPSRKS